MKRILLIFCVLASFVASAQKPPNYLPRNVREATIASWADSTLHIPAGTTPSLRGGGGRRSGALFYDSTGVDKGLYVWDGTTWVVTGTGGGGGGSDTANLIVANLGLGIPVLYPRNDTLFGGTFIAGTGITIDSAGGVITINATGGIYTGGSGITIVGTDIRNDLTTGLGVSNQTILASTIAFGDLTLSTTSHASKGNIFFGTSSYNEGNNSLGIRTASPTSALHITANVSLTDAPLRIDATTGAALAMTMQINASEGGGFKIIDGASSGYLPVLIGESFGVDGAGFSYIGEMPAADDVLDPLTAAITLEARRTDETNLTAANMFVLRTADYAPKVTVNFAGNMAVGNNLAPTERLHVGGNIRFSGALMPNNTAGTSGYFLTSGGPGVPPTWTPGVAGGSDTVVIVTPFTGIQIARQISSDTLHIASLIAGSNITITKVGDSTITISASGSSGEINTASNLGGGLANYSTKVGVDLRFNSFNSSHFDLASNLISVDTTTLFPIIRSTIPEEPIYLDYPLQADVDTVQISPTYLDSVWDAINAAGGAPDLSYDAANHQIDITGGGTSGTIPLADDDGATEGLASFAAADFTADANGNVVIDYANGQAATSGQDGFLQSADWTTFNNKQATLTLTTTGTSGAATLVGATLNIPQYAGGGAPALNTITGAGASNTIDNGVHAQSWGWNTLASTIGMTFASTSTAAASNTQELVRFSLSGANANNDQLTTTAKFFNTHSGTGSTNVAAHFQSTGGTTNIAAQFVRGKVILGTSGTENGILEFKGVTSGTAILKASDAAGTPTITLPTATGTLALTTGAGLPGEWVIACSDETTAITTETAKVTFRVPFAVTVTAVRASVNTVSSSGIPTIDINEAGTTILSTKLTIDASEKTSVTAAAAAVISDAALADDAEMTIDFDVAGTGAKGVKIIIYYTRN